LTVDDESDVAEKALIQDAVYGFAVIDGTIRFSDHTGARGGHLRFRHWGTDSGQAPRMGEGKV
jgi:hypothetical protein